ncbi:hypothetical protein V4R08_00810 [Nitrobacter sp. NHB1]|uniref:hypothetical protein n=1 Tax=Nitrobacter sp. NHB1 TaxID=3119830 RepID=UPI002FFE9A13
MLLMPAHFTAGASTKPLQTGMRFVSAVIGPDLHGDRVEVQPRPANFGLIAALCLTAAIALLLIVAGHGAGRRGDQVMAPLFFWSGVALLIVPLSARISWPLVARSERFFLLFLLVEALFYYKAVQSPTSFVGHDEFLHWIAADDLMTARRLFLSNPLLEVGPSYLALEILTTAIANLSGLSIFAAGTLLLVTLKGTFVVALFLFYERITGSARIAAIGCLVYMGCSTFVLFESMFSYESLGIVLCVLIFAVEATSRDLVGPPRLRAVGFMVLLLAALAVTHHLSAAYAAIYLGAVAILDILHRDGPMRTEARYAAFIAIVTIALPLLWMEVRGTQITSYLGPVVEGGVRNLLRMLDGLLSAHRSVTTTSSVPTEPFAMRLTTLLAVLLTALGLATGFFRSLALAAPRGRTGWLAIREIIARRWRDSRLVFLTVLAFGFPISVVFRLSTGGWEIGNRMGTLAFFGVGLVVAVSVVHYWQGRSPQGSQGWRRIAPAIALAVIVLGGVTSASLNPIQERYKVGADEQSIESMGIETALWTKAWLGPGNRFTSDRINRLLLAGYGRQDVKLSVSQGVDAGRVFRAKTLDSDNYWALANGDVDFLLVDLRLSTALPVLGFYFEPWEPRSATPLSAAALLKFDNVDGITRIYDNGYIVIYDVRGLHGRS